MPCGLIEMYWTKCQQSKAHNFMLTFPFNQIMTKSAHWWSWLCYLHRWCRHVLCPRCMFRLECLPVSSYKHATSGRWHFTDHHPLVSSCCPGHLAHVRSHCFGPTNATCGNFLTFHSLNQCSLVQKHAAKSYFFIMCSQNYILIIMIIPLEVIIITK